MSYSTVEAGILTVLRKLTATYTTTNTSRGDYRIVGTGQTRCVVLKKGPHKREHMTLKLEKVTWTTFIDLFIPWPGEQSTFETNIQTEVQNLVDQVAKWPALGAVAGVLNAEIINSDAPEPLEADGTPYRGVRLYCETQEDVDPGRQE